MYPTYYLLTSCFRNASITTQVTARKAKKKKKSDLCIIMENVPSGNYLSYLQLTKA